MCERARFRVADNKRSVHTCAPMRTFSVMFCLLALGDAARVSTPAVHVTQTRGARPDDARQCARGNQGRRPVRSGRPERVSLVASRNSAAGDRQSKPTPNAKLADAPRAQPQEDWRQRAQGNLPRDNMRRGGCGMQCDMPNGCDAGMLSAAGAI